ncbi:MAG TPA: His/Gly/Thr/Pro-type tRNA ligase C-terminal domain-containing protein [Thermoanaerobaculia bacterium]
MLVVGGREQEERTVSVRRRAGDDLGALKVAAFLDRVRPLVAERSGEL